MKKTLLAITLATLSASSIAADRFSNNFIELDKTTTDLKSGYEVDSLKLTTSVSMSEMTFFEVYANESKYDSLGIKEEGYGGYLGLEVPLHMNQNAVVFVKAGGGMAKAKFDTPEVEDTKENIKDVQFGFRWDYGLPRLDVKLYLGKKYFDKADLDNTYYGLNANYFLTRSFSIGVGLEKGEDFKDESASFKVRYHW